MDKKRQDAWTSNEDVMLAEIVLRHIRQGKTQLEAFKEASVKLSRTAAACGYRWNATLRKRYTEGIEVAKRSKLPNDQSVSTLNGTAEHSESIEHAISLLKRIKAKSDKRSEEEADNESIVKLKKENERLSKKVEHYEAAFAEIHNIWNWAKKMNIN